MRRHIQHRDRFVFVTIVKATRRGRDNILNGSVRLAGRDHEYLFDKGIDGQVRLFAPLNDDASPLQSATAYLASLGDFSKYVPCAAVRGVAVAIAVAAAPTPA